MPQGPSCPLEPLRSPSVACTQTGAWDPEEDDLLYYWQVLTAAKQPAVVLPGLQRPLRKRRAQLEQQQIAHT